MGEKTLGLVSTPSQLATVFTQAAAEQESPRDPCDPPNIDKPAIAVPDLILAQEISDMARVIEVRDTTDATASGPPIADDAVIVFDVLEHLHANHRIVIFLIALGLGGIPDRKDFGTVGAQTRPCNRVLAEIKAGIAETCLVEEKMGE